MHSPHLRYKNQTPQERTWTIHFLSIFKFLKGFLLLLVAVKFLTLFNQDIHQVFTNFIDRHRLDPDNRFIHAIIEKLAGVDNQQLMIFSVGSFIYSGVLLTEGVGLWFQKRWAEYLTTISTVLFIPVEIYEIYERFTWVRIAILIINLFIVWYLATRLRDEKKDTADG